MLNNTPIIGHYTEMQDKKTQKSLDAPIINNHDTLLLHRINRAIELIESHRLSEAMLLLNRDDIDALTREPSPIDPLSAEEVDERDINVDELAQLLHLAGKRFICLFQVLVRHPLLHRRQVCAIVPMHVGPEADGYELDALLFRFVPQHAALATIHFTTRVTRPAAYNGPALFHWASSSRCSISPKNQASMD